MIQRTAAFLGLLAFLGVSTETRAQDFAQQVNTPVVTSAAFDGTATLTCDNSPGPEVTLSGTLTLGGVNVAVIFRNNVKGTHTYVNDGTTVSDVFLPEGEAITIPKQPVLGGTGGNPFIWVQFLDGSDVPLSDEIFLGRCVQGLTTTAVAEVLPLTSLAAVDARSAARTIRVRSLPLTATLCSRVCRRALSSATTTTPSAARTRRRSRWTRRWSRRAGRFGSRSNPCWAVSAATPGSGCNSARRTALP